MESKNILDEIGGLPFLMDNFNARNLLTIAACVRRNLSSGTLFGLAEYVLPERALSVYKNAAGYKLPQIASSEINLNETDVINSTIKHIVKIMPHWNDLFSVPIIWKKLNDDRTSVTNRAIPQHIYLGISAFNGTQRLDEIIIHEMSHVWLGIIDEIIPIASHDSNQRFTLPSGTKDKDLHGVLLAVHFAASALTYFYTLQKSSGYDNSVALRIRYLEKYITGCINLLRDCNNLSATAQLILYECTKANRSDQ